jgi:hypothetical protein
MSGSRPRIEKAITWLVVLMRHGLLPNPKWPMPNSGSHGGKEWRVENLGEPRRNPRRLARGGAQMRKWRPLALAWLLFGTPALGTAQVEKVVAGINVYDEPFISQPAQDAEIEQMVAGGVRTIRTGLSAKSTYFIKQAFQHGIDSVVIVYPCAGTGAKGRKSWSDIPLSEANPQAFAKWLQPLLDDLEDTGVRLAAFELGNEINIPRFNGDLDDPGSGRVLGVADLNNPNDAEGRAVVVGFRAYLRVLASLKAVRDNSKLNKTTPILSAGLADWGLPSRTSWNKQVGVSLPDAIEFLRQNGLDEMADGYGVHNYPSGDPHLPVSTRISELEQKIFSACRKGSKPCWLTEWGFANANQYCPLEDGARMQLIEAERRAFNRFVRQGRLAAVLYYTWTGLPGQLDPMAVFRCGALTAAGRLAVSPM